MRLYGEEKERRDLAVLEQVKQRLGEHGRLPAERVQSIYEEVGKEFGLAASGVASIVPREMKPTPSETLEFARSRRSHRPRDIPVKQASPSQKRGASVADRVRDAALEWVDPSTGRLPPGRASEVYQILSERFGRKPGTITTYLKGLTPTAKECADYRWSKHRDGKEPDFSHHPAVLFPVAEDIKDTPARKRALRRLPREAAELVDSSGRLTDYDDVPEVVETQPRLDDVARSFLQEFKAEQARELVGTLRLHAGALHMFSATTGRDLDSLVSTLQNVGTNIREALSESGLFTREDIEEKERELSDARDYIKVLEEENQRLTDKLRLIQELVGS